MKYLSDASEVLAEVANVGRAEAGEADLRCGGETEDSRLNCRPQRETIQQRVASRPKKEDFFVLFCHIFLAFFHYESGH